MDLKEPTNIWMDFTSDETPPILNNTLQPSIEHSGSSSYTSYDAQDGWTLWRRIDGGQCKSSCDTRSRHEVNDRTVLIKPRRLNSESYYGSIEFSDENANLQTSTPLLNSVTENLSNDNEASVGSTICNILPILQGSALFAMPYAFVRGGILTIPIGIILSIIAYISSSLIIDCLYTVSPRSKLRKRVYGSYADLTIACLGTVGGNLLTILNIFSIVANNVVNIILVGECARQMLGNATKTSQLQLTMVMSLWFLPPTFVTKLSVFAYLSMLGVAATLIGGVSSLVVFIHHFHEWKSNIQPLMFVEIEGISLAMAIIMYSITLNIILPHVEGSMKKPNQSGIALAVSYIISTVYKTTFGLLGALTYSFSSKQLVSINTSTYSKVLVFVQGISLCIYAYTNFALNYFIVFEKTDSLIRQKWNEGKKMIAFGFVSSRVAVVVLTVIIAVVIPYFALVSAVIGAVVGTFLIFVTPFLFHLKLKWGLLPWFQRITESMLLVLGFVIGGLTIYSSVAAMIKEINK